jgi:DNA-binding transcriptional LysR family regulator
LFERRGQSVRLTEGGQAPLPMAQETIAAMQHMSEVMNSLEGKVAGDLSIGCSTTSGKYLLPNLVTTFRQDYPLVRVSIKVLARVIG